jgi:hypothetical protein
MCRCGGGSEHEHNSREIKYTKSLFEEVDLNKIRVINCKSSKGIENVFRRTFLPIANEMSEVEGNLVSDADEQIIITIP